MTFKDLLNEEFNYDFSEEAHLARMQRRKEREQRRKEELQKPSSPESIAYSKAFYDGCPNCLIHAFKPGDHQGNPDSGDICLAMQNDPLYCKYNTYRLKKGA